MKFLRWSLAIFCLLILPVSAQIIYVDDSATGNDDGSTWTDAYTNLTDALAVAGPSTNIWVAEGTYSDTPYTFVDGCYVYGGFTNGMATLGERDWNTYETSLSGGGTRRVIVGADLSGVDGCTIENGGPTSVDGAGIYVAGATTLFNIYNCKILNNASDLTGGGVYYSATTAAPVFSNVTFAGNSAQFGGGAYLFLNEATVISCTFSNNVVTEMGGGICYRPTSTGVDKRLAVIDSYFVTNGVADISPLSTQGGGAIGAYTIAREVKIVGSEFRNNYSSSAGGALMARYAWFNIENSQFYYNWTSAQNGGALCVVDNNTVNATNSIINCTFAGNGSELQGGAVWWALGANVGPLAEIRDSKFYGNNANRSGDASSILGGGIYLSGFDGIISNCVFSGNQVAGTGVSSKGGNIYTTAGYFDSWDNIIAGGYAPGEGGGVYNNDASNTWVNTLFAGNVAQFLGGGIRLFDIDQTVDFMNCHFVHNEVLSVAQLYHGGGAVGLQGPMDAALSNCVFYFNKAKNGTNFWSRYSTATFDIGDSVMQAGLASFYDYSSDGTLNSNGTWYTSDPLFVGGDTGTWSSDGVYDPVMGTMELYDSSASWTDDALIGKFVTTDTGGSLYTYYITDNGSTNIVIGGNPTNAISGAAYAIRDYQASSDSSPMVDNGSSDAPATDIDGVSRPQGAADDIGAYEFVSAPPGIALQKTVDVSVGTNGTPISYTFVVTNTGAVALTNVTVVDNDITPNLSTNLGTLVAGQAATTTVASAISGNLTNEAVASGYSDGTLYAATNTAVVTMVTPAIDITKTADPISGTNGTPVSYTFVVTNTGDVALTNVVVVDNDITPNLSTNLGTLTAGQAATTTVASAISGNLTNTATATGYWSALPFVDTDTAIVTEVTPAIAMTKTADPVSGTNGAAVTYTFVVTNTGDVALTNVIVVDNDITPNLSTNLGTLTAGQAATTTVASAISGNLTNTAAATGYYDAVAYVAQDTAVVTSFTPGLDLQKTVLPLAGTNGTPISYTFVVTNTGDVALTNVTLVDNDITPNLSTNLGTLVAGQAVTSTVVTALGGTVVNTATVTGYDPNGNPTDASDTATVTEETPGILLFKTVAPTWGTNGTPILYTFLVVNSGDTALTNVTLVDNDITPNLSTNLGTLALSQSVTTTVASVISGTLTNTANVTGYYLATPYAHADTAVVTESAPVPIPPAGGVLYFPGGYFAVGGKLLKIGN